MAKNYYGHFNNHGSHRDGGMKMDLFFRNVHAYLRGIVINASDKRYNKEGSFLS